MSLLRVRAYPVLQFSWLSLTNSARFLRRFLSRARFFGAGPMRSGLDFILLGVDSGGMLWCQSLDDLCHVIEHWSQALLQ
jgi:hypothetical protein